MSNSLQSLCIAPLTSPGKIGTTKVLSQPTQSWEKNGSPVVEGPAAMYHGGKTYLTYSASYCWTAQYSLGLLTWNGSGDPSLGASWAKSGPVFTSANSNYGPGHNGYALEPIDLPLPTANLIPGSSRAPMARRSGTYTTQLRTAQVRAMETDTLWRRRSTSTLTAYQTLAVLRSWAPVSLAPLASRTSVYELVHNSHFNAFRLYQSRGLM